MPEMPEYFSGSLEWMPGVAKFCQNSLCARVIGKECLSAIPYPRISAENFRKNIFKRCQKMNVMTWGELKKYCEEKGVPDDAELMVLVDHDPSVDFGEDGYERVFGTSFYSDRDNSLNIE